MRGTEIGGVAAIDLGGAAKRERLDIVAQQRARLGAVVDKQCERRAARHPLSEAWRAVTRKETRPARAVNGFFVGMHKDVDQGSAQAVGGGTVAAGEGCCVVAPLHPPPPPPHQSPPATRTVYSPPPCGE